ncbi:MAG: hypothetical protein K2W91_10415 [Novosphingobium sp.]|nr:hypothetical protein [Novosphingobium sp.]
MAHYDLAIHGSGLLPGLLACHLLHHDPQRRVLLLSSDRVVCGEHLEPVVASRLSPASTALVDPFVVASWPAYLETRGGETERFEEEVLLLDPQQVHLELLELLGEDCQVPDCGQVASDRAVVTWQGGNAEADRLVDLSPLQGPPGESEIVGMAMVRHLDLPVLADFDASGPWWEACQYLPLGDERLVIRRLPRRDGLLATQTTFESLLNGLTSN